MRSDVMVIVTCDSPRACLERAEIKVLPEFAISWQVRKHLHALGWVTENGVDLCDTCANHPAAFDALNSPTMEDGAWPLRQVTPMDPMARRVVARPGVWENVSRALAARHSIRWPTWAAVKGTAAARWQRFFERLVA